MPLIVVIKLLNRSDIFGTRGDKLEKGFVCKIVDRIVLQLPSITVNFFKIVNHLYNSYTGLFEELLVDWGHFLKRIWSSAQLNQALKTKVGSVFRPKASFKS